MDSYPEGRFADLSYLAGLLGNFWTEIFDGRALVYDYLRGATFQERQLDQLAVELFDSMGRQTCPVHHTDLWHYVELREDLGSAAGYLLYGSGLVYGSQPLTSLTYAYGTNKDPSWKFPALTDLAGLVFLQDAVVDPFLCLTAGIDFRLDAEKHELILATNPFQDARYTPFTGDDGVRRVRLYGFMVGLDWGYVDKVYGSVVDVRGPSSEHYKDLVNAVCDATAGGTAKDHLAAVLEAATGLPAARSDETVQYVTADATGLLIITDANVYRFPPETSAAVAVGDAVTRGQQLVTAISVYEPGDGVVPAAVTRLAANKGLLLPTIAGELVFENKQLPLSVQLNVSGFTKVTWPVGGFPDDVDAFFTEMHARGVAAGKVVAQYLDLRDAPVDQPTALNLPATVNPLGLLFQNLLRYNAVVVVLQVAELGSAGLGLSRLSTLRKVVSPHTLVLVLFVLPDLSDDVKMDTTGSGTETGFAESYVVAAV